MFSFDSIHTLLSGTLHCSWVVKIKFQKWQQSLFLTGYNCSGKIYLREQGKKFGNFQHIIIINFLSSTSSYQTNKALCKSQKSLPEPEPRTKRKCSTQFYTLVREQNKIFGKSTKAKNPPKPPQKNKEQSRVKRRESQTRLGREQTNKNISGGQLKYKGNFQKVTDNTSMSNLSLNVPFFFTMPSKGFSFALVPGVRGRDSVSEYQWVYSSKFEFLCGLFVILLILMYGSKFRFFYLYCDELDTHYPRGSVDPWSLPRTFFFSYLTRCGLHALVLVSAGYWLEGVTNYMYLWPGIKILCIQWNLDRPCHDRTKVNVFWVSAIKFKSSINSNWLRSTACNFFSSPI